MKELGYISMCSVFIPIILGIMQFKKSEKYLIVLFVLVSVSCIADLTTWHFTASRELMWSVFNMLESIAIVLIFKDIISIKSVKSIKIILLSVLAFFLLYTLIYHSYLINLNYIFPDIRLIQSCIFILISIYYFYYVMTYLPTDNLLQYPPFWISVAILMYFAGNLVLLSAVNVYNMEKIYTLYFPLHNMLNTMKNILFGVAFYVQYKYINANIR